MASAPVDLEFFLLSGPRPFRDLGARKPPAWARSFHPDGWGVGWYDAAGARLCREPLPAVESQLLPRLVRRLASRVFLCHVRKGTKGGRRERNCHPFKFDQYLFAHNGTVRSPLHEKLNQKHAQAVQGDTDSEVYFHWTLQNIEGCGGDIAGGLRRALAAVQDYSALNFLLSDGQSLFAFRQAHERENYYSLFYTMAAYPAISDSKALGGEKVVLVCSERLTEPEEEWKEVPLGSLLVVDKTLQVKQVAILP